MIIQCDHCSARFRMDDSKLANGPVKVRCAKCKEVFVVKPEEPASESLLTPSPVSLPVSEANLTSPTAPAKTGEESAVSSEFSFGTTVPADDDFSQGGDNFSFDADSPVVNKEPASVQPDTSDEFDWQGGTPSLDASESDSRFDLSSFNDSISTPVTPREQTVVAASEDDSNDFDFGDVNLDADSSESFKTTPPYESTKTDDFSVDFGEISFSDKGADSPVETDSFAESFDEPFAGNADLSAKPADASIADDFLLSFDTDSVQKESSLSEAKKVAEDVSFGEFSFGDMDESVTAKAAAPLTPPQAVPSEVFITSAGSLEYPEDELPPSSLTSRKKSGSLFPLVVIFGAIILIIALAGSGVYFFGGSKAFSKVGLGFLVGWYGDKGSEDGNITLKGVTASYLVNSTAGEMFVVRGEAVNNFKKSRASIQIKVSLLGTGGSVLVSKSAFCGNSISNEQLANLPLAKIDETMNNQFGDSLANLGLKPGTAIPFVLVISPVPKDASDYSVQVGGSTVATQ